MSIELTISSVLFLLVLIFFVLYLVKGRKISVKYSLVWIMPCAILLLFTLVPGIMISFTKLLGFQTASNMILVLLMCFVMVVILALTVIVSKQNEKIRLLVQEISILKSKRDK